MENRSRRYEISRPTPIDAGASSSPPRPSLPQPPPPRTCTGANLLPWSIRPLSDIRELSEPSLMDNVSRKPSVTFEPRRSTSRSSSIQQRRHSLRRVASNKSAKQAAQAPHWPDQLQENGSSSYSTTPEQPNVYSAPPSSIPQRSSSRTQSQRPSKVQIKDTRAFPPANAPLSAPRFVITSREPQGSSRKVAERQGESLLMCRDFRPPPRTFVRDPHPMEVLHFPCYKHPRVKVDMQISAPVFVGGGSIEGHIKLVVDGNEHMKHRRSLSIGTVSVDLLGFEDVTGSRKAAFLALGTDLIDASHPPPSEMVDTAHQFFTDGCFWPIARSSTALPFVISLPLHTGPPPFQSKHASIRFSLAATVSLRDTGKVYRVRTSRDVYVLPTYDPEKALTSLRSPLAASDEVTVRRGTGQEVVRLKASLHRQVWVSGSNIFIDIAINNMSRRPVKRLELALERDVLLYKHTAAGTMEKSASQARIFESNEQTILVKTTFKPGALEWGGVDAHSSDLRTCELALPRGHGTVRCGKYFEVRYFLNVIATVSSSKQVSVQLPIILIHINSLDVVPNSIAQVAAAIEEKRANLQRRRSQSRRAGGRSLRQRSGSSSLGAELRRCPSYGQGRAFAAPRQQSLDRLREQQADIDELRHVVDTSPRKHPRPAPTSASHKKSSSNQSPNSQVMRRRDFDGAAETRANLRPEKSQSSSRSENNSFRSRLRGMRSLETFRHRGFSGKHAVRELNTQPLVTRSTSQRSARQIMPHALGLSTAIPADDQSGTGPADPPINQVTAGVGFFEKLDRSHFDLKAVSRKASGGLKGRGLGWLERRRSQRDKREDAEEGNWI